MRFGRRRAATPGPLISVVVPAYDVAAYLPECLDSLLSQTHHQLEVVVVDDGSPDDCGAIAEAYAGRDERVRVVHIENRGLGGARNEGLRHVTGQYVAFADSDDTLPATAYEVLLGHLAGTGADLVTGSLVRAEAGGLSEPPWMHRLHHDRATLAIEQHPEILGDVFAWNKLFRADFWRENDLSWPEGVRYEDQPTTTLAYLRARRIGIVPDVVYHWRIRDDGSSITQQRSSLEDLRDRWRTKQMSLDSVVAHGSERVTQVFTDRVLAGDLHRYFVEIPGCSDEWWELLRSGVLALWGPRRSLTESGLLPPHRLVGYLVEQGRRAEAEAVVSCLTGDTLPTVDTAQGRRLDLPVIDHTTVPFEAWALRDHER
ncbi:MAG: glycosyltransferase family 2 protein [Nocardioides sp.]|nr:glycosyltransferase family 2 protein [Nocardioides sp.]